VAQLHLHFTGGR